MARLYINIDNTHFNHYKIVKNRSSLFEARSLPSGGWDKERKWKSENA